MYPPRDIMATGNVPTDGINADLIGVYCGSITHPRLTNIELGKGIKRRNITSAKNSEPRPTFKHQYMAQSNFTALKRTTVEGNRISMC